MRHGLALVLFPLVSLAATAAQAGEKPAAPAAPAPPTSAADPAATAFVQGCLTAGLGDKAAADPLAAELQKACEGLWTTVSARDGRSVVNISIDAKPSKDKGELSLATLNRATFPKGTGKLSVEVVGIARLEAAEGKLDEKAGFRWALKGHAKDAQIASAKLTAGACQAVGENERRCVVRMSTAAKADEAGVYQPTVSLMECGKGGDRKFGCGLHGQVIVAPR